MADDNALVKEITVRRLKDEMVAAVNALEFDAGTIVDATAAATAAGLSADAALLSEQDAETAAGAADTSAGQASTSATNAATSAGTASTDATAAQTARTGAETAQTGAEDARDTAQALAAAWTIVGNGRPDIPATLTTPGTADLVAAAANGTTFKSLDGPQGAWGWSKRSNAWVCIKGFTGWRSIASPVAAHPALTILLCRTETDVWVSVSESAPSSGGVALTQIATLPTGFWGTVGSFGALIDHQGIPVVGASLFLDSTSKRLVYIRKPGSARHLGQFNVVCVQDWPTTLPGTAA